MKEFLSSRFKNRRVGFYLGIASAVLMLAVDIAYIVTDYGDITFSMLSFALMLAGSLLTIIYSVLGYKFLDFIPVISCILYGFGFGQHLILALESLSDVWNGVSFIGGNATLGAIFIGLFFVPMAAAIVSAFMREDRKEAAPQNA